MKKSIIIGAAVLLCVACVGENELNKNTQPINVVANTTTVAPMATNTVPSVSYPAEFYRQNIVVKAMGEDYVVYEYSDIGVDKVASLASYYCAQTNPGKSAYLRDIYMTKNHHRRATFDCVNLATK